MKKLLVTSSLALSLALATGAYAAGEAGLSKIYKSTATGAPEKIVYDAASAMEFFRNLNGEWKNTPTDGASKIGYAGEQIDGSTFRTMAAGSTVAERYLAGSPYEMEIMYHMDGPDKLMLAHYCSAKNVPIQNFVKTDKPGQIKFEFAGGANLDPKVDPHFHAATFQVIDKDTYTLTATSWHEGKATVRTGTFTRKSKETEAAAAK